MRWYRMPDNLMIVKINFDYCDYLRKHDNRVSYNAGKKILRPFVGVLFQMNEFKYFAPLSSPKKKHLLMRDNQVFLRLDKGRLGAINFNNMIPVLENNIEKIDLDKPCETEQEKKYQDLLKKQMYFLNRNKTRLFSKSMKLYKNYIADKLPDSLKMRCCNFPLFEEKCLEYNKSHSLKISELS